MSSKYLALWNELKTRKFATVELPRSEHELIIKAMRRESADDTGFRFKCVEADCWCTIGYAQIDNKLYLHLDFHAGSPPQSFVVSPDKIIRKQLSSNGKYETRHLSESELLWKAKLKKELDK